MDFPAQILQMSFGISAPARRRRAASGRGAAALVAVAAVAALVACAAAATCAQGAAAQAAAAAQRSARATAPVATPSLATDGDLSFPPNQTLLLTYRAWNGALRQAVVLLPAGYTGAEQAPLPCVIAAHGRDMPPSVVAQRWGELPSDLGFAVICADSAGVHEPYNSWAAPGQLRDLMRLPDLVERAAAWVHLDRRRLYGAGVSMGAQEVLCLAARYPDRLAGVAAFDGVTDLSARYREVLLSARGGPGVRSQMRHEMGGNPQEAPFAYRLRSPQTYALTLATAGVPLQLWWSPRDARVINQATTQTGALYRLIRRAGPAPQVVEMKTDLAHGVAFAAGKGFVQMLAGFRPNGEWALSATAPPPRWTYVGALREAHFWGYGVRLVRPPSSTWRVELIGTQEAHVRSSVALWLSVPCGDAQTTVVVSVNGRRQTVSPAGGAFTLRVPAGSATVLIETPQERRPWGPPDENHPMRPSR